MKSPENKHTEPANARQVGGDHYAAPIQHWDFVASNKLDYFQGQITKYVSRCWKKNGLEDLLKARHFLDKYIELHTPPQREPERMTLTPFGRELVETHAKLAAAKQAEILGSALLSPGEKVLSYRDFVFEGAKEGNDIYTCMHCKWQLVIPANHNPNHYHECAKPKGYVNQG